MAVPYFRKGFTTKHTKSTKAFFEAVRLHRF